MRQEYTGDETASERRRRRRRERPSFREQLQGLSWWQVALVLLPLVMMFIGGALGGGIGGGAAVGNLSLARKPMPSAVKFLVMACVCAVAFTVFFVLEYAIRSVWAPTPYVASQPGTGYAPVVVNTPATPSPLSTCWAQTWAPRPVAMNRPVVIHATGAEVSWPAYANITCNPANDLAAYEIHRSTRPDFTPSAATLVATVNANDTSFVDRTAPATSDPRAAYYVYMVAVRTRSGQVVAGATQLVRLPKPGQTELVLQTDKAASLSAKSPDTIVDPNGYSLTVSPDIGGEGAERAVFEFGPLTALPRGAFVTDARLNVACHGTNSATISVYGLTRTFDASVATWNSAASGVKWRHPGGDYTTPSGSSMAGSSELNPCDFDATAIVRGWTDLRSAEHGLLLRFGDESSSLGYGAYEAGDTGNPDDRPALVVTYE